ncbi:MAG: hypothetical protein ABH874_00810 [Methanobacteriota archaeon]
MTLKEDLKQNLIGSFIGALFFFVLFMLYLTYALTNLKPEYLNLALITMLVGITILYVLATWNMVTETRKDRKIQFYTDTLEKFYSPLINHPVFWKINHSAFAQYLNEMPNAESADGRRAKEFLDTINKYDYLASKEVEPYLYKFQVVVRSGAANLEPKEKPADEKYEEFKIKFEEVLRKDYINYKSRLKALLKES